MAGADLYVQDTTGNRPQRQPKRSRYEQMRAAYWTDRTSFDSHWRELGDFLLPRRTRFWPGDRNKGDKRNQNIIDSTGRFAARTLASGLHAGLTSPARPWMKLTTPDPSLAKYQPVKEWLHQVTQLMLTVFEESNLYNALPIVYGDMGVFGTSAAALMDDTRDVFRTFPYPIGSYALGLDHRGVATTFIREYELTVRSLVEQFGVIEGKRDIDWSRISAFVKNLWEQGEYETGVQVAWIVLPNEDASSDRLEAKYLPWASYHWERGIYGATNQSYTNDSDKGLFLRESGFRNFPIVAPRWDVNSPEDSYGTDCPGMTALGDIKQLQIMQKRKGQAIAKQIDPPLVGPSALRSQKTSLLPGDVTYLDTREGQLGLRSIHEVNINLADLTADVGQTQYRIQRAFYEDLFLMLARTSDASNSSSQPITAREVDERHEEKLLALGPVLERTNDELLDPIVDRVYALMDRKGLIPPAPQELHGVKLKVEYISILAQAQKLAGVTAQDRFLQSTLPLVQSSPAVAHKIDFMAIVDSYADKLGVDPSIVIPSDQARKTLAAEQQQHQAAADANNAKTTMEAAKAGAAAPLDGNTALAAMVKQANLTRGAQAAVPGPAQAPPPALPAGTAGTP